MTDQPTIYLVACAATKRKHASTASELYTSTWFTKASDLAKRESDQWYILSAKHGIVDPDWYIAPYNKSLNTMKLAARRRWGKMVSKQLKQIILLHGANVVVLAGRRYRDPIWEALLEVAGTVSVPMDGLGIGQQLQWLNTALKRRPKEQKISDVITFLDENDNVCECKDFPAETSKNLNFIASKMPGSTWSVWCGKLQMTAVFYPEPHRIRERKVVGIPTLRIAQIDATQPRYDLNPRWIGCKDVILDANQYDLWIVVMSYLPEPLVGRGLGKKLYEAGMAYARSKGGKYMGPDACWGGSTSHNAMRVWDSLCRDHECDGPWIKL